MRWAIALRNHISQTNFRAYYKAIRGPFRGKFGAVYEVERKCDGQHFAVKAYLKTDLRQEIALYHSICKEIKVLRLLRHENVLNVKQVYESNSSIYILTEFLSGKTLYDHLRYPNHESAHKFGLQELRHLVHGLLKALQYIHSMGYVHRDIKPENIMLRDPNSFEPVVIDFGFATSVLDPNPIQILCGTAGFIAPEDFVMPRNVDWRVNPKSDVFSLGITIYNIIFKTLPWLGQNESEILDSNRKLRWKANLNLSHVEPHLADLISRMLEVDPRERISVIEAL